MSKVKVLFVCMGNICRSPTAQGVFEKMISEADLATRIEVDSAGTHAYHVGEPPDRRATEAAARRGIDLTQQRARRVSGADLLEYDYVLAMDENNFADLAELSLPEQRAEMRLLLDYAQDTRLREVPDPYYGGSAGFERVLDLIEAAAAGLLAEIRLQHDI